MQGLRCGEAGLLYQRSLCPLAEIWMQWGLPSIQRLGGGSLVISNGDCPSRGVGTTCGLCKHHDMKLFRMPEHVPETRYTNVQKQTLPTKYPQGQNRLHMFSCAEVALGNSLARHHVCSPYTYSKSNTYILTHIYLYILTHPYTVGISPLNKSLSSLKLNLVASKLF